METIIPVWKPAGWTPLMVVDRLKEQLQYAGKKLSYAGRLDPMAEGVLLILVGDENKKRKSYESLHKTYEAEIAWGVTTDTYDALGVVDQILLERMPAENKIKEALLSLIGSQKQQYPPYSSKTVNGKPLFWWARNDKLSEIILPVRDIEVFSAELLGSYAINVKDFCKEVVGRITSVEGDFRQNQIVSGWQFLATTHQDKNIMVSRVRISCGSGTYIRGLAAELGKRLSIGAIASSIVRVEVGDYMKKDCIVIEELN